MALNTFQVALKRFVLSAGEALKQLQMQIPTSPMLAAVEDAQMQAMGVINAIDQEGGGSSPSTGVLTLASITPNSAAHGVSTTFSLVGTGFTGDMDVVIGPPVTEFLGAVSVISDTTASVLYLGGFPAGLYDITVNGNGQSFTLPASLTLT